MGILRKVYRLYRDASDAELIGCGALMVIGGMTLFMLAIVAANVVKP